MPSARSSMLDRATPQDATPDEWQTRPVAFRGVGIAFISALFPIPKIALLPLLILWLGIGEEPKIATIALGVFFSTAISVYSGVDAVPRNLIRMAQSFNVPFHAIVFRVIWPG